MLFFIKMAENNTQNILLISETDKIFYKLIIAGAIFTQCLHEIAQKNQLAIGYNILDLNKNISL